MELTIYAPDGTELYTMPEIYTDCVERAELMSEDSIELHFSLAEPVYFPVGAHCEWNGKRYEVTEAQSPSYNQSTGGYDYTLTLDAYYIAWKNRILAYIPCPTSQAAEYTGVVQKAFTLTADLQTHAECIRRFFIHAGLSYESGEKTEAFSFSVLDSAAKRAENKTISYESVSVLDALNSIAEEYDCEWWVDGSVVYLGKCELKDSVAFQIGVNVATMNGSKSSADYASRFYIYGGTDNVPTNYGKTLQPFEVDTDGYKYPAFKAKGRDFKSGYLSSDAEYENKNDIERYFYMPPNYTLASSGNKGGQYNTYQWYEFRSDIFTNSKNFPISKDVISYGFAAYDENDNEVGKPTITLSTTNNVDIRYARVTIYLNVSTTSGKSKRCTVLIKEMNDASKTLDIPFPANSAYGQKVADLFSVGDTAVLYYTVKVEFGYAQGGVEMTNLSVSQNFEYWGCKVHHDTGIIKRTRITFLDGYYEGQTRDAFFITSGEVYDKNNKLSDTINVSFVIGTFNETMQRFIADGVMPETGVHFTLSNLIKAKLPAAWFVDDDNEIYALEEERLTLPSTLDGVSARYKEKWDALGLVLRNGYIDTKETLQPCEVVEKVLTIEDVFPRVETETDEVRTALIKNDETDENGNALDSWTMYAVHTSDYEFKEDFRLSDGADGYKQLQIKFTTGALAGFTFDCIHSPTNKETFKDCFAIERSEVATGVYWPNETMRPRSAADYEADNDTTHYDTEEGKWVGDKFILLGWDTSRLEDLGLVELAKAELVEAAVDEIEDCVEDPSTYECTMFPDTSYGLFTTSAEITRGAKIGETLAQGEARLTNVKGDILTDGSAGTLNADKAQVFGIGQRVTLYNRAFFADGKRDSRILGYERKMDIPWDAPAYTIGKKAKYSRFTEIEKKIENVGVTAAGNKSLSSGISASTGGGVYLITSNDSTEPSDTNAFSALRTSRNFLRSTEDCSAIGQIRFYSGLTARSGAENDGVTAADGIIEGTDI